MSILVVTDYVDQPSFDCEPMNKIVIKQERKKNIMKTKSLAQPVCFVIC